MMTVGGGPGPSLGIRSVKGPLGPWNVALWSTRSMQLHFSHMEVAEEPIIADLGRQDIPM